jgi:hypothetical protein
MDRSTNKELDVNVTQFISIFDNIGSGTGKRQFTEAVKEKEEE